MQNGQYVDEYRKNAVNGASPLQLVIMLYDGAIRFCELGRAAMASGDRFAQNTNLVKAQRILTELTSCLDMKQGGEVAKNLLSLYTFAYNELVKANLEDNSDSIDQAVKVLSSLRESWGALEEQTRATGEPDDLAA